MRNAYRIKPRVICPACGRFVPKTYGTPVPLCWNCPKRSEFRTRYLASQRERESRPEPVQ